VIVIEYFALTVFMLHRVVRVVHFAYQNGRQTGGTSNITYFPWCSSSNIKQSRPCVDTVGELAS